MPQIVLEKRISSIIPDEILEEYKEYFLKLDELNGKIYSNLDEIREDLGTFFYFPKSINVNLNGKLPVIVTEIPLKLMTRPPIKEYHVGLVRLIEE